MPVRSGFDSWVERYFTGAGFSGVVLLAEDPRFEGARRIWNGMIDRTPALIAYCRNTPDVKQRSALPGRPAGPCQSAAVAITSRSVRLPMAR